MKMSENLIIQHRVRGRW